VKERIKTVGRVVGAGGVVNERSITVGRVEVAGCVGIERFETAGRVVAASRVVLERSNTVGRRVRRGDCPCALPRVAPEKVRLAKFCQTSGAHAGSGEVERG